MATLKNTLIDDVGYLKLPSGTTAQRPGSPSAGYMRWNTTDSVVEVYNGSGWFKLNTNIITNNLLLHYSALDLNSYSGSGTTWFDLTNNNIDATIYGSPSFVTGSISYFDMDGSDDVFTVTGRDWRQDFTFEIWVQINSTAVSNGLFGQGGFSVNNGMHILHSDGARGMIFAFYANDNDYQANYEPSANTWYHWVFTYNHTTYNKEFYADGVLQTPGASVENAYNGTGDWQIGATYSSATTKISGKIAIVRAYTKTLSPAEVATNFNAQKNIFGK